MHQSVIAGSSFFLTRLVEAFQQKENYLTYLVCYLAAMLFPYLPGCMSYVTLQSWINDSHRRITTRLADTSYGLTEKYRDANARRITESVISRNSFIVIKDYLTFLHGFFGFFLNSFLSMVVLGILLPGNLLVGYFLSVALCIGIVLFLKKWISHLSTNVESDFIVYSEMLSKMWGNATLGNKYNYELWSKGKDQLADHYYSRSTKLQFVKQSGNFLLACASLGPTIFLVYHVLGPPSLDPVLIAAVIVSLTRIFHILNSLSSLVYQLLDWSSINARLRVVFSVQASLLSAEYFPTMPAGEIRVNEIPVKKFSDATQLVAAKSHGRFTIKGENGSGKSTLLQIIKKTMGEQATLIPANEGGLYWSVDTQYLSTGQSAMVRIQEAASQALIKYLLLDEWDANLDDTNTRGIDQMLNELSQTIVVIEVRH